MSDESIQSKIALPDLGFVYLVGEIDEELCAKVVVGIMESLRHPIIHLAISSEGGDLWCGMAMADAIESARSAGINVEAEVLGHCFSSATFPFLSASKRTMQKNAWLGIHGMSAMTHGDMKDMEAEHAFNKRLAAQQARFYAAHSKRPAEYWEPILREKVVRYYNADEALKEGLVDAVSG